MKTWVTKLLLLAALMGIDFAYLTYVLPNCSYPGLYFYAGLVGVATVVFLRIFGKSRLVRRLQILHAVWIAIHAYGFAIYMLYFPPISYNCFQVILNIAQIYLIISYRDDTTEFIYDFCRRHDLCYDDSNLCRVHHTGKNK